MNQKNVILVSGKNGQLGKELQEISSSYKNFQFIFFDKEELNIADEAALANIFQKYTPSFFINCAAYTAVDKAETDREDAYLINAEAVGSIAKICYQYKTKLIHISTDYVFNGKGENPYPENYITDPLNYYGYTKLTGEKFALNNNPETIIIRTSWVYCSYGNNFVKTMLRLMKERKEISVVNDQFGSPTYAKDLAEAIMVIVSSEWLTVNSEKVNHQWSNYNEAQASNLKAQRDSGIYNFSNDGIISWFDFAVAIKENKQLSCSINPIPGSAYPVPAKRPSYSGLDKTKITTTFNIQLKNWKESLDYCLKLL